jgi:hypothetical protein
MAAAVAGPPTFAFDAISRGSLKTLEPRTAMNATWTARRRRMEIRRGQPPVTASCRLAVAPTCHEIMTRVRSISAALVGRSEVRGIFPESSGYDFRVSRVKKHMQNDAAPN